MATLEVGPKSNLVVYEMMPTRRRKAIPVHLTPQQHDDPVGLAFSADSKLLATLLPEVPPSGPGLAASAFATAPTSHASPRGSSASLTTHLTSYSITVYLWRTGKTLASISLGSTSAAAISPQVCTTSSGAVSESITLLCERLALPRAV